MIDLHTHTLFSDGELLPSELVRRAEITGYQTIAITDHADISNYDFVIPRIAAVCRKINEKKGILAIPGIELTHINPKDIKHLAMEARKLGALIIVVHGETIVEPVNPGTNRNAILSKVDILAHPGLIKEDDVKLAVKNNVCLEITSRNGHSLSNGHVAKLSMKYGAKLILNTDTHAPRDLLTIERAEMVAKGAGLTSADFKQMLKNSKALVRTAFKK
jgi:histidinol phosphatase-like PHP family hydrolase